MPIYIVCPTCKNEYSSKHKSCPKCNTPRPKGVMTVRIHVNHNYKTVRKEFTGVTLPQAKQLETKLKQALIDSVYSLTDKKIPFDLFFEKKYVPYAKEKVSFPREESYYRLWIKPVIGNKSLSTISPLDIEKIKRNILQAGRSPRTAEYAIAVVRQVFNKAAEWGFYSGTNPVKSVKVKKADNRRLRFLTKEEAKRLLEELKKHSQQVYEMAYISLYTGMRFGEIANLKWQDIDFQNKLIHVKDPKNRTSRVAYMTDGVEQILTQRKERLPNLKTKPESFVFFTKNGSKIIRISRTFERVVNKLGFNDGITDPRDKVVFHTLRHTFASWLAIQGTPIYTIKELMGHKTLAMTERYSHLIPDTKREAVKKLE